MLLKAGSHPARRRCYHCRNGELQTTDVLVTKVRLRVGPPPAAGITLDQLLLDEERARRCIQESWRRNGLIRFGPVERYPIPGIVLTMNKDITRRDIPVPSSGKETEPGLEQNPGYPQ